MRLFLLWPHCFWDKCGSARLNICPCSRNLSKREKMFLFGWQIILLNLSTVSTIFSCFWQLIFCSRLCLLMALDATKKLVSKYSFRTLWEAVAACSDICCFAKVAFSSLSPAKVVSAQLLWSMVSMAAVMRAKPGMKNTFAYQWHQANTARASSTLI